MATIAFDSSAEKGAAKLPISLHPAFPIIVALWFAALLGLGSLVLPAVLLDRIVAGTGIATLIPAAGPPLGFTARGIIAVAAAISGAGLGIAIARRVALAHSPRPGSRIAKLAGGSRQPIRVREEVGGEGVINGESLPINRRRALAISEDDRPSDFLYQAPLPAGDIEASDLSSAAPVDGTADEPLELHELAEDDVRRGATAALGDDSDVHEDPDMTDNPEFQPTSSLQLSDAPAPEFEDAHEFEDRKTMGRQHGLEPLHFAAPSQARRTAEREPPPQPEVEFETIAATIAANEMRESRPDWETAPLDDLGLVQLVQRLGSTIERRRELRAQGTPTPAIAASAPSPLGFEPAAAEEAAQATAAYFGSVPTTRTTPPDNESATATVETERLPHVDAPIAMARPAFLSPLTLEDGEGDEDESEGAFPDFSLPLPRVASAAPSFALADNDANGEDDKAEGGYGSLIGMSNPFAAPKGKFVRVEEPEEACDIVEPAVVFPGQEAPTLLGDSEGETETSSPSRRLFDPPGKDAALPASAGAPQTNADADTSLRAALATLQRMSDAV